MSYLGPVVLRTGSCGWLCKALACVLYWGLNVFPRLGAFDRGYEERDPPL